LLLRPSYFGIGNCRRLGPYLIIIVAVLARQLVLEISEQLCGALFGRRLQRLCASVYEAAQLFTFGLAHELSSPAITFSPICSLIALETATRSFLLTPFLSVPRIPSFPSRSRTCSRPTLWTNARL